MQTKELRIFAILLVLLLTGTEALLAYNTLYTEGEVMQGLYWLLVSVNLPILVIVLWKPWIGIWMVFGLGFLLIPWQAYQNKKCAQIHEEIISIIRYVDSQKKTGDYPKTLDGYTFQRPWVADQVSYQLSDDSYRIYYFMDNKGISFWYDADYGFDYYPD